MKKGTLFGIIAFIAFLSAVAGALYVLKKRGLLLCDCCDLEFDDCDCGCNDDVSEEKTEE